MDTGGWFLIEDLLDKVNRNVCSRSRASSTMDLHELAMLASDGTENLSRLRLQLSVLLRRTARPGVTCWQRIVKVFGIRAVVGHTATRCLEDDRLMLGLEGVDDDMFPCIALNTEIRHLNSIIKTGLAPGGDGVMQATSVTTGFKKAVEVARRTQSTTIT